MTSVGSPAAPLLLCHTTIFLGAGRHSPLEARIQPGPCLSACARCGMGWPGAGAAEQHPNRATVWSAPACRRCRTTTLCRQICLPAPTFQERPGFRVPRRHTPPEGQVPSPPGPGVLLHAKDREGRGCANTAATDRPACAWVDGGRRWPISSGKPPHGLRCHNPERRQSYTSIVSAAAWRASLRTGGPAERRCQGETKD